MSKEATAVVNDRGRIECGRYEFSSGDVVDVLIDGTWHITRIEFDFSGQQYYSVDGLPLIGHVIRYAAA
jgi:hypothetical protein